MEDAVSIDFLLQSNIPEEARKSGDAVDDLADRVLHASSRAQAHLKLQEEVLVAIRGRMREVEHALATAATPKDASALRKRLRETRTELSEQETYVAKVRKEVERLDKSSSPLLARMRELRTEMEALVATGQQGSDRYRRAQEELRGLAEAQRAVAGEQLRMAKGADLSGLRGIAGAYSAIAGVATLVTGSTEDYAKAQAKLQSAIALTVGLQQVQETFSKSGAFRMQTVTGATRLFARAQTALATSLRISDTSAKALTATLTLGLSIAITAAVTALDKYITRQRQAREEERKLSEAVAGGMASDLATFRRLQQEWDRLDLPGREAFVRKSAEAFHRLGVSVTSVADAERVLVREEEAFVASLQHRAMAAALMDVAAEKYREGIQKMLDADKEATRITPADYLAAFGQTVSVETVSRRRAEKTRQRGKDLIAEADDMIRQVVTEQERQAKALAEAGVKAYTGNVKAGTKAATRLTEDAARLLEKIERDTQAAMLAAQEDGARQRLARLEAEHASRLQTIEQYRKRLEELRRADPQADLSREETALERLSSEETARYTRERTALVEGSADALRSIEASLTADLSSELDRRLEESGRHYDALERQTHASALSEAEEERILSQIMQARIRETERLRKEADLDRLDRMEQIRIRKAELESADAPALLRTDREEHVLRVRLDQVQQRLAILHALAALGTDVSEALADATLEAERLSHELAGMPVRKMQELSEAAGAVLGSLSSLPGKVGETFGVLAKGATGVARSMDKSLTTTDRVTMAVSGLSSILSMAMETAKSSAEAEEEWAHKLESAYHRAALARIEALSHKPSNLWSVEDPYAVASAGALKYRAAMEELAKSLARMQQGTVQVGTRKVVSGSNVATGLAGGAAAGAAVGSIIPGLGTAIGAAIGGALGGIFGAVKTKVVPAFDSLAKHYGSLLKEGTDSFELNPRILEDYDRLDDSTKHLVDNWEEIRSKAVEAQQEMEESLKSLTGDLARQLSDALVSGIESGDVDRAMADFGHKMDEVLASIAQERAFAAFFQSYFDTLSKEMKASMDVGGDGDIIDDLQRFRAAIQTRIPEAAAAFEEINRAFGVLHEGAEAERRAVAKRGLAQASQDSIDELMGIETSELLQLRLLVSLAEAGHRASDSSARLLSAMSRDVALIADNSGYLPRLRAIEEALDRLTRDGISIKS